MPAASPLPSPPPITPPASPPRAAEDEAQIGGLTIRARIAHPYREILTPEALAFVRGLAERFDPTRQALLLARRERQARLDAGEFPDFLPETREIRQAKWRVAPIPADLLDRRVEITGPPERKMMINAMNSGARVFMVDFEDSASPTWEVMMEGQANLRDAVRRTITYTSPEGKEYRLGPKLATLVVRPRGWHLTDRNVLLDGEPLSASLLDFGLAFFHNARELLARGSGPYFYLPKMESHKEARLWAEVFRHAEAALGIAPGSIRATVLIETVLAAFEMHEILWELKDYASGLNCGRWDYIFSFIKCFRNHPAYVLPDRRQLTMTSPFLHAYSLLLIKTCHERGIHAMGGMAAQIPIKDDPEANARAMEKIRADKVREVVDGHDGTWVAHPGLVPLVTGIFDVHMPGPHQIGRQRDDVVVTAADLLALPTGEITEDGLANDVSAALRYTESWLGGQGCVPLFNLMEDAATAEIARAQIWQWIKYPRGRLVDGRQVTAELFAAQLAGELARIEAELGAERYAQRKFPQAAALLTRMVTQADLPAFLTLEAYGLLRRE
jgi:malate synthase